MGDRYIKYKVVGSTGKVEGVILDNKEYVSKESINRYKYTNAKITADSRIIPKNTINVIDNREIFKRFSISETEEFEVGGAEPKLSVDNGRVMLKFPRSKADNVINEHIAEYLGCRIAKKMGYGVQEVALAYCGNKECVAIKMFRYRLVTFDSMGDSTINEGGGYELEWILKCPISEEKLGYSYMEYKERVLELIALDFILGNRDRHKGNFAFRKVNGVYVLSDIYDMGASLSPRMIGRQDLMQMTIGEIKDNIYKTMSAIEIKGKKRSFIETLRILKGDEMAREIFGEAIKKICSIDITDELNAIIIYNNDYEEYTKFIVRVISSRIDIIKEEMGI